MDTFRFIVITGMSGAGKTKVMQALEDIGYYCVDNLPPVLLGRFADLCSHSSAGNQHVAVVTDIRGGTFFDTLPQAVEELNRLNISYEIVFLEASDEVLVRRYMETRRSHPLAPQQRLQEGIAAERKILAPIRAQADIILDTTTMDTDQLHDFLRSRFGIQHDGARMTVTVCSFGFKYGIPIDADMIFDVRFLPNPFYVEKYRYWTGRVPEVADFIGKAPVTKQFLEKLFDMLDFLIPHFEKAGRAQFTIAVGCTGGMHRSVYATEMLGAHLREKGVLVNVEHRDMTKNRIDHDGTEELK